MTSPVLQDEETILKMSPREFDQSPNGWRALASVGENLKAAELIRKYIERNKERISNSAEQKNDIGLSFMNFHIGQLLAAAGQKHWKEAIVAFEGSFEEGEECWNAYVSGTIGFLKGDVKRIEDAIRTVELSPAQDKRWGNVGILRNFKKALGIGEKDIKKIYFWEKETANPK